MTSDGPRTPSDLRWVVLRGLSSNPVRALLDRFDAAPVAQAGPKHQAPDRAFRFSRTQTKASQGHSLQKIGDQLGWDHNTIYRQLKRRGVVMRGPSDWKYD